MSCNYIYILLNTKLSYLYAGIHTTETLWYKMTKIKMVSINMLLYVLRKTRQMSKASAQVN